MSGPLYYHTRLVPTSESDFQRSFFVRLVARAFWVRSCVCGGAHHPSPRRHPFGFIIVQPDQHSIHHILCFPTSLVASLRLSSHFISTIFPCITEILLASQEETSVKTNRKNVSPQRLPHFLRQRYDPPFRVKHSNAENGFHGAKNGLMSELESLVESFKSRHPR